MKKILLLLLLLFILTSCTEKCGNAPVCGKINVQCVTTPCDPVQETFENRCVANERKAFDIKEGACITNFEECVKAGNPVMESYPRQCKDHGKNFVEEIEVPINKKEIKLEETLINGKTTEQRIQEAYDMLHAPGSAQHARDNFPDFEVVFIDNPKSGYPKEILPFEYYYSKEADKTFNLCAIERTVFICDGKIEHVVTDEELNSNKCIVTPVYQKPEQ